MANASVRVLRWCAVLPVAVMAALIAQYGTFRVAAWLLYKAGGATSLPWGAKCVSSLFIGAAFVAVARSVAPDKKALAATLALGIVALWSARLVASAFDGEFFAWLFAMGIAGLLGGAGAFWFGRRSPSAVAS